MEQPARGRTAGRAVSAPEYEDAAHDALQCAGTLAGMPSDADVSGVLLAEGLAGIIYATLAVAAAIREAS